MRDFPKLQMFAFNRNTEIYNEMAVTVNLVVKTNRPSENL